MPGNRSQKGSWRRANEWEKDENTHRKTETVRNESRRRRLVGKEKNLSPRFVIVNRSRVQSRCLRFESSFNVLNYNLNSLTHSLSVSHFLSHITWWWLLIAKSAAAVKTEGKSWMMNDRENEEWRRAKPTIRTNVTNIIYKHILISFFLFSTCCIFLLPHPHLFSSRFPFYLIQQKRLKQTTGTSLTFNQSINYCCLFMFWSIFLRYLSFPFNTCCVHSRQCSYDHSRGWTFNQHIK